jgi:hypothetical protein
MKGRAEMRHRGGDALRVSVLALAGGLASLPALAQAGGGGAGGPSLQSDTVPLRRTIPEHEQIDSDLSRARMRLGPVRVLPSFRIYNAGYDSNVFATSEDPVGDWTATVSAGARFLMPMGSKFYFRADGFPQYTWYAELTQRDKFGGIYNGSIYGFFNRMTVELRGDYTQTYRLYSSEVDSQVFQTSTTGSGSVELELSSHWSLFGSGEYQDVHYQQIEGPPGQDLGVPLNNRHDWGGRGGIRYLISDTVSVGFAGEGTFADFEVTPELRNNTSNAALATIEFNRPRFFLNLVGGYREGRGSDSNFFPDYSTGVGSFFASYFPISWLEIQASGHRMVNYSITLVNPYFFESRIGGKVNVQVANSILLSGFGQFGPNNYPRAQLVDGELVHRRDYANQYGGGFSVLLWRPLVLTARALRTKYTSNIPTDLRDYTRYTVMLSFGGTFER